MTAQPALFYRGAVPTTLSTVYNVPSSTEIVVTSIILANASGGPANTTIRLGGIEIIKDGIITAGDSIHFDIRQVLLAADAIEAASDVAGITLHVSGVEVA